MKVLFRSTSLLPNECRLANTNTVKPSVPATRVIRFHRILLSPLFEMLQVIPKLKSSPSLCCRTRNTRNGSSHWVSYGQEWSHLSYDTMQLKRRTKSQLLSSHIGALSRRLQILPKFNQPMSPYSHSIHITKSGPSLRSQSLVRATAIDKRPKHGSLSTYI